MAVNVGRNLIRIRPGTVFAILTTLLLFFIFHTSSDLPSGAGSGTNVRSSTASFLERAETIYQRHVQDRAEYMLKYGSLADDFDPWRFTNDYMEWWGYFQPSFNCPHEVERIGKFSDGGKWVCGLSLYEEKKITRPCVVYSFCTSNWFTFEIELIKRANCEIWAYVPDLREVRQEIKANPKIHLFENVYVGKSDRAARDGKTYKTLETIMGENGHKWVDFINLDVEGDEYKVVDQWMQTFEVLPFTQLQMEIHLQRSTDDQVAFKDFRLWWERLESHHLRPFWTELHGVPEVLANLGIKFSEYSFLNIAGGHELLQ